MFATDFSEGARAALKVAAKLAGKANAELEIVYAWQLPITAPVEGTVFPVGVVQQVVEDAERGLRDVVPEARAAGASRVSTKLLEGAAWDAITREVERDPTIDLVVVGTHGRTGLSRVVLGSVAERIVRHAPCSVLVVRTPATEFDHVACAIDFSEASRAAVQLAAAYANPRGRGITLLHVLDLPVTFSGQFMAPGFIEDLDRNASSQLDDWAASARVLTTAPVKAVQRIGGAGAQVLAMLDEDPTFDLVVVGSHGRTGIKRLLLGSIAERVVRHAKASVLVARDRKAT